MSELCLGPHKGSVGVMLPSQHRSVIAHISAINSTAAIQMNGSDTRGTLQSDGIHGL